MRQKILFIITKGTWGGAQRYVFDLATSIPKDSYDVAVAFGSPGLLKNKLDQQNIRTIVIDTLGRNIHPLLDIKTFFALIILFRKERPTIVHLNSSKIGGLGALAARIAGVKKILFTAHGWAFNEDRNIVVTFIIKFLSWLTIIFCHTIIVLGEKEKKQGQAFLFSKYKIVKISNGISPPDFKDRNESRNFITQKAQLTSEAQSLPWIVTIAELHKNKGYEYALEAIHNLNKPALYFIIGEGEERHILERIIQEKNLQSKVFLLGGYKEMNNPAQYLKAFDIFLLSSVKEGLPYVLLEAGSAQLPVIATNVGNIPEIITDNITGMLISPKQPQLLAQKLEMLLTSKDLQAEFGNKLHTHIINNFSLANMAKETLRVYNNN